MADFSLVRPSVPKTRRPMPVSFPAAGIMALESRHARGFSMEPTTHDYLKVVVAFSGNGTLCGRGWEQSLEAGDVVVVPAGYEHRIRDRHPLFLYVLCFRADEFSDSFQPWICKSGVSRIRGGLELIGELTRRLLHEQQAGRSAGEAMSRGLGWQILASLERALSEAHPSKPAGDPTGSRSRVREAMADLGNRFYERLNLEDAARRARLGRRRFTQLFREVNGTTWWEALNAARMAHAERLLRGTDRSVAAVAFECGYGELSGFYRAWAAKRTLSPQAWRKARAGA